MSIENMPTNKIVTLYAGYPEWDGITAKLVCKYIEPIGFSADFCAEGYKTDGDHTLNGAYTSVDDSQVVSSPASGGFFQKVHISSTSSVGIKLHLVKVYD